MQIVIEISEEAKQAFDRASSQDIYGCYYDYNSTIGKAIKNGIVLPKGHGKLIAEPTEEDIAKTVGGQNDLAVCIKDAVKAVFDNVPTIIEADRSEK